MIKANITTEIAPIVGTKEQAEDLVEYIKTSTGENGEDIWDVNIFGKSIEQLVEDGLNTKTNKMNVESKQKLQDTMEKIVNDGNGGLVCIII
jgi:stage IV sporulation protein A